MSVDLPAGGASTVESMGSRCGMVEYASWSMSCGCWEANPRRPANGGKGSKSPMEELTLALIGLNSGVGDSCDTDILHLARIRPGAVKPCVRESATGWRWTQPDQRPINWPVGGNGRTSPVLEGSCGSRLQGRLDRPRARKCCFACGERR